MRYVLKNGQKTSTDDGEVLAYLISRTRDPNRISRFKKEKPKEDYHHSPLHLCDCFRCYTSYWLGSNSGELAGGDSVDEGRCGEEEAEKKKGFVE
ncbi:hypothetical protein HID58_079321 [Brassica napus]|uniref:Uncharacterized protein n=1 Tax=Brassica napus TaxID=3708 RepID=A0ABQ7Y4Q3_BRANA|nr:hypothetical protein HID58_079321 [Brassica napus]